MKHSSKLRNMASLYFTHNDQILLLYRKGNSIVSNMWIGSAGGHFEKEELNEPTACILRETYEELGISENEIMDLQLRYITLRSTDEEIRQNYYFFGQLDPATFSKLQSTEGDLEWFRLDQISDLVMPFTAHYVLDHYIETGRHDTNLYGGIANNTGVTFISL